MDVLPALESLPGELEQFASELDACVKSSPSRLHLRTYLAGQIGERPRKSVEPIALAAGVPPRTLQGFLASHRWDEHPLSPKTKCDRTQVSHPNAHQTLRASIG